MKKLGFLLPAIMSVVIVGCATTDEQITSEDNNAAQAVNTNGKDTSGLSPKERNPNVKPMPMPTVKPKTEAPVVKMTKTTDGKLILGQTEWVHLEGVDANVVARVDTGATTSSISAIDVVPFERDGKNWVKFKLSHGIQESKDIELPVKDTKRIVQSNTEKPVERPVVEGWITVGDLKVKTPFTLADRTHMSYGLLLGRSFFRDVAIVDVSRKFVQPKVDIKK